MKRIRVFVAVWIVISSCSRLCRSQTTTTTYIGEFPSAGGDVYEGGGSRQHVSVVSGSSYDKIFEGNLTVDPEFAVSVFTIPGRTITSKSLYNISFVIPDPPEGCDPNVTLWYASAVYFPEFCAERDWMGKCTGPGADGFRDVEDVKLGYGLLKTSVFDYEVDEVDPVYATIISQEELAYLMQIKKTLKGAFCYDDRDYWLAFSTDCAQPMVVQIEVGTKDLSFSAKWTCRGFDYFLLAQKGSDAFLTSRLFWCIVVPIGYFVFLVAVIYGCDRIFGCGAKGRVTKLLHISMNLDFEDSDSDGDSRRKRE